MVQWLLSANIRPLAALVAIGALVACGTTPVERRADTPAAGWRVVERVGEARYSPPGSDIWLAAATGQSIIAGSQIETGRAGRLIVAAPGRHISVGSASRFLLPPSGQEPLEQRAGWLRYRVTDSGAKPVRVHTRALDLEFATAVLDVRVEQGGTAVAVSEGDVRLATPDGSRHAELAAGQSAQASGPGSAQLALRRSSEDAPEPVLPVIVPAMHPLRTATVAPATTAIAREAPDTVRREATTSLPGRDGLDQEGPEGAATAISLTPATATPDGDPTARSDGRASAPDLGTRSGLFMVPGNGAGIAPAVDPVSTGRRGKFERLTEGVIDGVQPVHPTAPRP